ncbi:threonine aldolase, partial [Tremellales sp. Uapishka_1]
MPIPKHTADITAEVGGQANVDKLRAISRDFRSDTLTVPTDAQLLFALQASRGDDVYGEDEATNQLEARIARLSGKEAAMFAVSGTMTNQLAIRTHMKQPPHSVITDHRAHVHLMEAGGIAMFSQATTHALVPTGTHLSAADIEAKLELGTNIHIAPTKLICLENTLSGIIFPQEEAVKIGKLAHSHDIAMHCDGARIWNVAAAALEAKGLEANEENLQSVLTELLEPFDTASLCLSKGIGAPIGSALVGSKEFIARAKWFRKAFGGGIRQSGGLAASADYALTHHFPRLAATHALARRLAEGLKELGCDILGQVDTNMASRVTSLSIFLFDHYKQVFFDPSPIGVFLDDVMASLAGLPEPINIMRSRCVVHHQTSPQAVEDFISTVRSLKEGVKLNKEGIDGEEKEEANLRQRAVFGGYGHAK